MTNSRERRDVEEKFGPIREGLLSRLQAGIKYKQIAREWDVHYNTILTWMDEENIERRVTYGVRESAGVGG